MRWRLVALLYQLVGVLAIFAPLACTARSKARDAGRVWVELKDGALFDELADGEPWLLVLHSPACALVLAASVLACRARGAEGTA